MEPGLPFTSTIRTESYGQERYGPVSSSRENSKVQSRLLPSSKVDAIIKKKIKEYGVLDSAVKKESMIYPLKGQLKRVWKVKFAPRSQRPPGSCSLTRPPGTSLKKKTFCGGRGQGQVFIPNPW